jgi:cell division septation protein DedD
VYTIQVGVFTSESKAEAMVSQLKTRQYDAVFIDAIPAGAGPYHVRVGRLSDMQAAKDLQRKLQADGFATFLTTLSQ